jgi:hypothetical protein
MQYVFSTHFAGRFAKTFCLQLSEKETELRKQMEREKDNFASHIKMMQDGEFFLDIKIHLIA